MATQDYTDDEVRYLAAIIYDIVSKVNSRVFGRLGQPMYAKYNDLTLAEQEQGFIGLRARILRESLLGYVERKRPDWGEAAYGAVMEKLEQLSRFPTILPALPAYDPIRSPLSPDEALRQMARIDAVMDGKGIKWESPDSDRFGRGDRVRITGTRYDGSSILTGVITSLTHDGTGAAVRFDDQGPDEDQDVFKLSELLPITEQRTYGSLLSLPKTYLEYIDLAEKIKKAVPNRFELITSINNCLSIISRDLNNTDAKEFIVLKARELRLF